MDPLVVACLAVVLLLAVAVGFGKLARRVGHRYPTVLPSPLELQKKLGRRVAEVLCEEIGPLARARVWIEVVPGQGPHIVTTEIKAE